MVMMKRKAEAINKNTHTYTYAGTQTNGLIFKRSYRIEGEEKFSQISINFCCQLNVWEKTGDKELTFSFVSLSVYAYECYAEYVCAKFTSIL